MPMNFSRKPFPNQKRCLFAAVMLVFVTAPSFAKHKKELPMIVAPRPTALQSYEDLDGKKNVGITQEDSQAGVEVTMTSEGNRVVRVLLGIVNKTDKALLFAPSTTYITVPNGKAYAPFTRAEAIAAIEQRYPYRQAARSGGYNPPAPNVKTDCATSGANTTCTSAEDQSNVVGYNIGYGLGSLIVNRSANKKYNKQLNELKQIYLISKEIQPGKDLIGIADFYVEDITGGPFVLTIPLGPNTYIFTFGPNLIEQHE